MKQELHLNETDLIMACNHLKHIVRDREEPRGLNCKFLLDVSQPKHKNTFGTEAEETGCIEVGEEGWLIIEPDESCIIKNSKPYSISHFLCILLT